MRFLNQEKDRLTEVIRGNGAVGGGKRLRLAVSLSIPAIIAQISAIIMQYIDAAMVGSLGAGPSASIGLVTTSTWIFFGLCSAASVGFSVQVAHLIGSGNEEGARSVFRQSLIATFLLSLLMASIGVAISKPLPYWLGGSPDINGNATLYFMITMIAMPVFQYSYLAAGMLRCSGNMVFPGVIGVLVCVLDVAFNFFLIFPTRDTILLGVPMTVPGVGLGVWGAAAGTALAEVVATSIMLWKLIFARGPLRLFRRHWSFKLHRESMKNAFKIGFPVAIERFLTSGAQVILTIIVAPLGACSIAANAFAVVAESICYMPGYGIADAATTLIGQSIGAGRKRLASQFAYTCVGMGMCVMTVLGVIMYFTAPYIIGLMTPDAEILRLGVVALRTEAWAEPLYAAAIVCYGAFVGAGDTIIPSVMNLGCMWVIRIILAAILAPIYGLHGVWIAMCFELCCRGLFFLSRLRSGRWMNRIDRLKIA